MERIQNAEHVRAAHAAGDLIDDGRPQIAFAGRSNVGKSSLLNRLLGRRRLARTSSTPGRTQAVHYYLVNDSLWFVDLPGYGYAKASQKQRAGWATLVDAYLRKAAGKATVVLLVDGKIGGTALDGQAHAYLRELGVDPVVVATKVDKLGRAKRGAMQRQVRENLGLTAEEKVIEVSATTGEGIRELWREMGVQVG